MKVRPDIAALIREGHTNASIAHRLGCDRSTVANARRALRLPPADRLGRLYLEAVPTGRVKDYRPDGRMPTSPTPPPTWTPEEQDAHWNALCQAVKTPGAPRPTH